MNIDLLRVVSTYVENLVSSVNKRNSTAVYTELKHLIEDWGREAETHVYRQLLLRIDLNSESAVSTKDNCQVSLLKEFIKKRACQSEFFPTFVDAFDNVVVNEAAKNQAFLHLLKALKLPRVHEVLLCLFAELSLLVEVRSSATECVRRKLPHILRSFNEAESFEKSELSDLTPESLRYLLSCIRIQKGENFDLLKQSFLKSLRQAFPTKKAPLAVLPLLPGTVDQISLEALPDNDTVMESAKKMNVPLSEQIREIGYVFCADNETCRRNLATLTSDLSPEKMAHVLSMMMRTTGALSEGSALTEAKHWSEDNDTSDTWNIDVFVDTVNEMFPSLNWTDVVSEMDHPEFFVKDRHRLILLTRALLKGLKKTSFPISHLYFLWMNREGQLSWISQIVQNTDVFCLCDYPCRKVQCDFLRTFTEDNRDTMQWMILDLVEILLSLGEYSNLCSTVVDVFDTPAKRCPDVVTIALLQATVPFTTLRQDLLLKLLPVFFGSHVNSLMVLNYAWNNTGQIQQAVRNIILQSLTNWYFSSQDDQAKLSRILEIAHDLKALTALFNVQQHMFSLDLACLASRRDYLKLDRWLNEKIVQYGEPFVQTCLIFLKQKCACIFNCASTPDNQKIGSSLPLEVVSTIVVALNQHISSMPPALSSEVLQLLSQCRLSIGRTATSPATPMHVSTNAGTGSGPGTANTPTPVAPSSAPSFASRPSPGVASFSANIQAATGIKPMSSDMYVPPSGSPSSLPSRFDPAIGKLPMVSSIGSGLINPAVSQQFPNPVFGSTPLSSLSPTRHICQPLVGGAPSDGSGGLLKAVPPPTGWGAGFAMSGNVNSVSPVVKPGQGLTGIAAQLIPNSMMSDPTMPDISQIFPDDVQEEANSYFQQIYTQPPQPSMSTEQFLDVLRRFRDSPVKKEREVFACMIKNLFEEYRFFGQYPDKELHTTAKLFGGVIRDNLVSGMPILFALRVVMDTLRKEPGSKLHEFGIIAIDQFKTRLKDYQRYCQAVMSQVLHFGQFPRNLIQYIQYGSQGEEPPPHVLTSETPIHQQPPLNSVLAHIPQIPAMHSGSMPSIPSTAATVVSVPVAVPSVSHISAADSLKPKPTLTATNIDTLVTATEKEESKVLVPPESVQDKVAFLFNNLSQANLPQKVAEMKELLVDDQYLPWLAQYLVMKRVSAESNFHNLYSNFVTAMGSKALNSLVLLETYRNIKILLRCDKVMANFSDRTLLKNLGHWLGLITVGQNKPILQRDIDLKTLLIEAFWKGQQELLYVVPFVAKIMESCQKSKGFKPPSPWTTGILNVLAELHQEPDLKLNLKFEIEVLCRHLNVELANLKPDNVLKDGRLTERVLQEPQLCNPAKLEKPTLASTLDVSPVSHVHMTPVAGGSASSLPLASMPCDETGVMAAAASSSGSSVPRFSYHDIYITSFQGLAPHITINASLPLFQLNPPLKHVVKPAIEHAVRELITPVADRALKVALTTTESIVKKDFALEPDETKMRLAAHNMVRSLTAGMAMITCRDPLQFNVQGYLKQAFFSSMRGYTTDQQRMMEEASQIIAEDNIELAQCFIVKSAAEKALLEIDKRLAHEFEMRRLARVENRQYYDAQMLKMQEDRMPMHIRLRAGSIDPVQIAVYEEFVRNIPGFKQSTSEDLFIPFQTRPWTGGPAVEESELLFQHMLHEVDSRLQIGIPSATASPGYQALLNIREALLIASQNPRDTISAQGLVQKLVEILLESYIPRSEVEWSSCLRDTFLSIIKNLIQIFGSNWVQKQVTKVLMECRRDCRFNVDAVDILIRSQLVNMVTYDLQLAQSMESGMNYPAVHFAQQLVRLYFVEDRQVSVISEPDLSNTIEVLSRIANSQAAPVHEGRNGNLLEMLRALPTDTMFTTGSLGPAAAPPAGVTNIGRNQMDFSGGYSPATLAGLGAVSHSQAPMNQPQPFVSSNLLSPQSSQISSYSTGSSVSVPRSQFYVHLESGVSQARDYCGDDPPGLHDKAEALLREWVSMFHSQAAQRDQAKAFNAFVNQMHQNGILKSDDLITRFFRNCTEMCVDLCHRILSEGAVNSPLCRTRCFHTLDAYVHLIALLVRNSGEGTYMTKLNLLNKVLGIITGTLLLDQNVRREAFHPLPFHRILIMLFLELTTGDPVLEPIMFQILNAFCNILHFLRPRKAPCFTYSWMDIIGHRTFINRLLTHQSTMKTWGLYAQLIIDHLHFLSPFLRNLEFQKAVTIVYKGTLRILLVLLHDFPELLCDYHYALCDTIPANCVQLRNLVLSAYPRNMRLPDPFMPSLQVDQLPEISSSPRLNVNLAQYIQPPSLKNDLDAYLKNRAPVSFLSELRSKLQVSNEPGRKYDVSLMNAVVLYVGMQAIQAIQSKEQRPNITTIAHTAHMDIFQNLAVDLDTEGRYLFFNAIANHLRYPNSHTHYFSCTILYLFAEANSEAIQEQITRILFERLVALRPHPWGLLITFIELIKNPVFKFWNHQFVRCAPEIEKYASMIRCRRF